MIVDRIFREQSNIHGKEGVSAQNECFLFAEINRAEGILSLKEGERSL